MFENIEIKLVTTRKWRNYLWSEPNYHTTKVSLENLFAIKNEKKSNTYE